MTKLVSKDNTKLLVSFFNRVTRTKAKGYIALERLMLLIKNGTWSKRLKFCRRFLYNKDIFNHKKKELLPAFIASVQCSSRSNSIIFQDKYIRYNWLIVMDFDSLDFDQLLSVKNKLKNDQYVHFMFTSPSGSGIKVGVKIRPMFSESELICTHNNSQDVENKLKNLHSVNIFNTVSHYFKETYDIDADIHCKDLFRVCYISDDPDLYYNKESKELKVKSQNKSAKKTINEENTQCNPSYSQGHRDTGLFNEALNLFKKGKNLDYVKAIIIDKARNCYPAFPLEEAISKVRSAYKIHKNFKSDRNLMSEKEAVDFIEESYFKVKAPSMFIQRVIDPLTGGIKYYYPTNRDLYNNLSYIRVQTDSGKIVTGDKAWIQSRHKNEYESVVFDPSCKCGNDVFNLFTGFGVVPKKGDCGLFLKHLEEIVCEGNKDCYEYFLNWLAHMFQRPEVLPEVSIVMQGLQGVGKGIVADNIGKMVGNHYMHLTAMEELVGKFNDHLADKILVFCDEALWGSGNKKFIGTLKSLVTNKLSSVEPKGKTRYTVNTYKRILIASNESNPVHMDRDDRRFMILRVKDTHKGNHKYFKAIKKQMDNGGREALMYFLLHRDISNFVSGDKPTTKYDVDVKLENASHLDQWWWDRLSYADTKTWKSKVISKDLYNEYLTYCSSLNIKRVYSSRSFARKLKSLVNYTVNLNAYDPTFVEERKRYYILGSLEKCRKDFKEAFHCGDNVFND